MSKIIMLIGTKAMKFIYGVIIILILDFFFKTSITFESALIISFFFLVYDVIEHFIIKQMRNETRGVITKE